MPNAVDYAEFIDKYCERTVSGLWGEPLNVLSNIAFLVVFVLLFRFYRVNFTGQMLRYWDITLLIILLFLITLGSTVWHVFAVRWALYSDAFPILLFINVYLLSCFVRVLRLRFLWIVALFLLYQLFNYVIQLNFSIDTLNGSIFYLPVYFVLFGVLFQVCRRQDSLSSYYFIALGLFTVALVLRTFDLSQCDRFPIGTHFLWHIIIAAMLYFLTKPLMLSQLKAHEFGPKP